MSYYNYSYFYAPYLLYFGGGFGNNSTAGAFHFCVFYSAIYFYIDTGGRLMFL